MVGGGCFSIFRRADDVTRTMSKGGGVFQFSGGRMTSRRQCPSPRGGGGACKSPPSGNPVSAPVICVKFWAINPSAPLQSVPNAYGPVHVCMCVYMCVCLYCNLFDVVVLSYVMDLTDM